MTKYRFDAYLPTINAEQLKKMAKLWGGDNKTRKDQAISIILAGLSSPPKIKMALASLEPYEHTALALVKQANNYLEPKALILALRASGVPLPDFSKSHYRSSHEDNIIIHDLLERGLFLLQDNYTIGLNFYSPQSEINGIFIDDRLLEYIGTPTCYPFDLSPCEIDAPSIQRRPSTIMLDLIGILHAIDNMGGFQLTKSGAVRVSSMRQLKRLMDWKKDFLEMDGLALPNPEQAFTYAMYTSKVLTVQDKEILGLARTVDEFAAQPYHEQIKSLLAGFIQSKDWLENGQQPVLYNTKYYIAGRIALVTALIALPKNETGFFAINDFIESLYKRIGQHFSLSGDIQKPYYFHHNPEQIKDAENKRLAQLHQNWQTHIRPWFEQALSTWLYYLGLVEVQLREGKPVALRLTELGRTLFHPELNSEPKKIDASTVQTKQASAWIIQPNFEVVVYLDRARPEQLIFLERHAEKIQVQQYIAQYRLTRESVYQGLERGINLDDLITELEKGAGVELPQNVLVDLREWGALREKITIHRQACLLEFPDSAARDAALKTKVKGALIGERFLLLSMKAPRSWTVEHIDYTEPLPRCLAVNESGYIKITHPTHDLLLTAQLNKWAEGESDRMWKLTEASIAIAMKAKARLNELFNLLDERLVLRRLPRFLEIALQAWGRRKVEVELATVTILQCADLEVFQAIVSSKKLKPYIKGTLASNLLLVDQETLADFKKELAWAKIEVVEEIKPKGVLP